MKVNRYNVLIILALLWVSPFKAVLGQYSNIYFNCGASDIAAPPAPWNSSQSLCSTGTMSNLIDDQQHATTVGIQFVDSWTGANSYGMLIGLYPTEVMQTCYYMSDNLARQVRIFGLNPSFRYTFTFFASRNGGGNRNTLYTINGTSVQLDASNNTTNTVQITGTLPNAAGEVYITVSKQTDALFGYLNALVISPENLDMPQAPTSLGAFATSGTEVKLLWTDNATNETGYSIERRNGSGSYMQVASLGANATSYTNTGLTPKTLYTYRVRAYNTVGSSTYSNETLVCTMSKMKIYFNCSSGATVASTPWNNSSSLSTGGTLYNLTNDQQQLTQVGITFLDSWTGTNAAGMTGGIYPDQVTQTTYFIGDNNQRHVRVFGLDPNGKYTFTFFGSRSGTGNRTTQYTINSITVSLEASNNTRNTVQISGLSPNTAGEVNISVNKLAASSYGYLNALVIEKQIDVVPQYNGNISAVQWKVSTSSTDPQANDLKEYDYCYDAMNRITSSQYQNRSSATYNGAYDEGNYTYDTNGNLQSLRRNGFKSGVPEVMDDLTYTYGTNSNQLQAVSDGADKTFGFVDKDNTTDYEYDANGNMVKDKNKGIDTIIYNLLNLPDKIISGSDSIVYTYDALGVKLCKKVYKAGILSLTVDYNGELEFYDNKLKMVHTEEGMARYDDVTKTYDYEYFLKDHLGNTRAVVTLDASNNLSVLEATSYYPFGMAHNPMTPQNDNKYLYNGKERQDDVIGGVTLDLYDYGQRYYDPQIGRFHTQDAFAEKYLNMSPYQYAANNPILNIDVNGDSVSLGNLYDKNKDGQYLYPQLIGSFELFASTKDGKQYILDHAQKGFELKGAFVEGLDIKADKSGALNDKGVDIAINEGTVVDNNGRPAYGKTEDKTVDGRLKLSFTFDNNEAKSFDGGFRDKMLNNVDTYSHEFFLHGALNEQKFLNGSTINPYSHEESSVYPSKFFGGSSNYSASPAYRILNSVQSRSINMNQGQTKYTDRQLFNHFTAPGLRWLTVPIP